MPAPWRFPSVHRADAKASVVINYVIFQLLPNSASGGSALRIIAWPDETFRVRFAAAQASLRAPWLASEYSAGKGGQGRRAASGLL